METYFKNITPEDGTAEKLMHDLRVLRHDAEDLFRVAGGRLAERSRQRLLRATDKARVACRNLQDQAAAGLRTTDEAINEHPYAAVGIALGVGLLAGMLAFRRSRR